VRYFGEPVAAVAAVDEQTAEQALKLIRLRVRELPVIGNAAQARAPGAVLLHDNKPGNIEREVHNEFGDTPPGFAAADLIREETYHTAEVTHAQMEPHAAMASYDARRATTSPCTP
jgi:4-hydroxybenzoyl-CoA reductase subunit alpha